jgi:hypothetical protein
MVTNERKRKVKSFPVQSSFQEQQQGQRVNYHQVVSLWTSCNTLFAISTEKARPLSPHNFSSAKEMMGGYHAWAVCIMNEFEKTSQNHQSVPLVMVLRKICLMRGELSMILAAPAAGVKLLRIEDL